MKQALFAVALTGYLALATVGHAQVWKQVGPDPINGSQYSNLPNATVSGIVTDIAVDPSGSTDSIIYVATGAGGVWKTTNGGSSWSSKSNSMPILFLGAVAVDPKNPSVVYAGVGGPYCCFTGGGIYRSTDAAEHWTLRNPVTPSNPNGIFSGLAIVAVVLPTSDILLVATTGGLYKSVDGGKNFGSNAPKFNNGSPIPVTTPSGVVSTGNISDLKLDTAAPTTVYVAIDGQGVYKSTDSGSSFSASGKLFSQNSFPPGITGDVFIKIAQSTRPDNKIIYAFLCDGSTSSGEPCALLKSTNSHYKFHQISLTKIKVNQQDYDQIVAVDPQDATKVYIGLRQLYFSADGGSSGFSPSNQIDVNGSHTDEHAIAFSPPSHFTGPPTRVFIGSDGGLSSTAAGGSAPGSLWQFLNQGLATGLLYDADIGRGSKGNNSYSYGALQDNGTVSKALGTGWQSRCCGDSPRVTVDPLNPLHVLTINSANGGNGLLTCAADGQSFSNCNNNLPANTVPLGLVRFDPGGGVAYAATNPSSNQPQNFQILQSTNNGGSFSLMNTFSQPVSTMAQVKGAPNTLWVGLSNGTIWRTQDALQGLASSWKQITVNCAPAVPSNCAPSGQSVNGIAIDPTDTKTVVVVYPGFSGSADPPQHVFRTTDDGKHWHNIGGTANGGDNNIPDLPLYAVVILPTTNPHTIIVGSDAGVLQSADDGKTWQVLGTGFPSVQVTSLSLDSSVQPFVLRASTFGRSIFELVGSCPLCPPLPRCKSSTQGCYLNYAITVTCRGLNVGLDYNGGCQLDDGAPIPCHAGYTAADTVSTSFGGPPFYSASYQACTVNNNYSNCTTFTPTPPSAECQYGSSPPPVNPQCGPGWKWCTKYYPPRCVIDSDCEFTGLPPH